MIRLILKTVFLTAMGTLLLGRIAVAEELPIAVVGGQSFAHREMEAIIAQVLKEELPEVTYQQFATHLPAEEFSRYRMVILSGSAEEGADYGSEEASATVIGYVENGGRLLLIRNAPQRFVAEGRGSGPVGASIYHRMNPTSAIHQPDAAILRDVVEPGGSPGSPSSPFWLAGNVLLKDQAGWEKIVGTDQAILVGRQSLGEGRVYYLGSELFRVLKTGKEQEKEREARGWVCLIRNIVTEQ